MDIVRIWHSKDASIIVPFADIVAFDEPRPGTVVIETLSLDITIEGVGLDTLTDRLVRHECSDIRVTAGTLLAAGDQEPIIRRVIVTQTARAGTRTPARSRRPRPSA
ncbi:MAG TPA: hypothetical protein VHB79_24140 [Polyangiaceae bacterium]|nr:hypothetical protein [Polyangiaceae bacterium]